MCVFCVIVVHLGMYFWSEACHDNTCSFSTTSVAHCTLHHFVRTRYPATLVKELSIKWWEIAEGDSCTLDALKYHKYLQM